MKTKMKTQNTRKFLLGTILALTASFALPTAVRAADHGDGPTAANDQACDIADVFFFMDPTDVTNQTAIIIGTFRGFIVPSEASNFGIFDPNVRYRFLVENTGDANPDKFIDVSFTKKTSSAPQTAAIRISGTAGVFTAPATAATLNDTANPQTTTALGMTGIQFFAGEVDDPFFFDIVGFNRAVAALTANPPNPGAAVTALGRARDSFAGYNIMSIALKVPISLLKASGANASNTLGLSFQTQRHVVETPGLDGETTGSGGFRTIDRMGIPAVNVALVPLALKNRCNAGSPLQDSQGRFAAPIVATINAVMRGLGKNQTQIDAAVATLASVAVNKGDMLRLDTTIANTGNGGGTNAPAAFPNGRRLADDTIDTILSILNSGSALGDGVNANDVPLQNTFPFIGLPQQPRANGVTVTVDDNTRN